MMSEQVNSVAKMSPIMKTACFLEHVATDSRPLRDRLYTTLAYPEDIIYLENTC